MKKIIWLMLAAFVSQTTLAQCTSFYYLQNNKTVTMDMFNRKGKPTGKYIYKVSDVKNSGNSSTSAVETEILDEKGKKIAGSTGKFECTNGIYLVDMKLMMPPQQAGQTGEIRASTAFFLEYPANMKVGDVLKDGNLNADIDSEKGVDMTVEMNVTNRKVEAEETITTPAGTWKCFRITLNSRFRTSIGGIGIPINLATTEWFAPGFGIVKTESKWGITELSSIK